MTELVNFLGELLALALLCRSFCLGSFELKCKLWQMWVAVYSVIDSVYTDGDRAWSNSSAGGSKRSCFDREG